MAEKMNEFMTIREVAEYLRFHTSTIYRLAKSRKIPSYKVGNQWRFKRQEIEEWLRNARNDT